MKQASLLSAEQLMEWTGINRPSELIQWLNKNDIPYRVDKLGRPITTIAAVDGSLFGNQVSEVITF